MPRGVWTSRSVKGRRFADLVGGDFSDALEVASETHPVQLDLLIADLADPVAEEGILFREVDNHRRLISGKPTLKNLNRYLSNGTRAKPISGESMWGEEVGATQFKMTYEVSWDGVTERSEGYERGGQGRWSDEVLGIGGLVAV